MIEIIKSIEKAIDKECYLPALALALTIPDICGEIEYPHFIKKNGTRSVRKQYRSWFDDWVNHYFADHTGFIEGGKKASNPYFTGDMCYELRCAYLHSGNSDISDFGDKEDSEWRYTYSFELCINGCDSYGEMWNEPQLNVDKKLKNKMVRVDIENLCVYLCESAKRYYESRNGEGFDKHKIQVIDIRKESKRFRHLRKETLWKRQHE